MDLGIRGKVALIIGGSQGIGYASARQLAEEGANVYIVSRSKPNVQAAIEMLQAEGAMVDGTAADCLTKEGLQVAIDGVAARFGWPDIVVYVPYVTIMGRIDEVTDEQFEAGDNALVVQFMRLARAVLPHMKAQRWGRIVTIGSMAVRQTHRHVPHAVPNTYRMAAIGLSKTMADEVAEYGITVNTIATGSIATAAFESTFQDIASRNGEDYETMMTAKASNIPMKRFGKPAEMGAVCAFLCSEPAGYVTGVTLLVDGGKVEVPI